MFTQLELTSTHLITIVASVFIGIAAIILALRYYLKSQSTRNLTDKYKDKVWSSPLEARNKYPDVDVFKMSGPLTKLGFAASLVLMIGLMNWTQYEAAVDFEDLVMIEEEEISIEPPRTAEPPPPPPPPPPPVIQEVPDELMLEEEDDIQFMDQSIDEETIIEERPPVVEEKKEEAPPPPPPPPPPMDEPEEIFKVVEQMPRFPGCEDVAGTFKEKEACANKKLFEFIYSNIRYPLVARENGIQGNVVVSFVVNRDGSIEQATVLRDAGGGTGEEAIRIVNLMNEQGLRWIPGKQRGQSVRVRFMLPVKFRLETS